MRKILFYLAITGWTVSLILQIQKISLFITSNELHMSWILIIGILIVSIASLYRLCLIDHPDTGMLYRDDPSRSINIFFKQIPEWLKIFVIVSSLYAFVNNILFIPEYGDIEIKNGQFILYDEEPMMRIISEKEYNIFQAYELRNFGGIYMIFYAIAAAVLFPGKKR